MRGKVVIVSDGAGSHPNSKAYPPDRLRALREEEAKRAGAELGLKPEDMLFLGLPDRFVPREGEEAERAIGSHRSIASRKLARDRFLSAGDTIRIATIEASYRIAREVQRRVGELRLFEYVVWGHTLPPSTEVDPIRAGSGSASIARLSKRSAAPLPRTARRQPISSTTILPDFDSRQIDLARFDLPYEFFLESDA